VRGAIYSIHRNSIICLFRELLIKPHLLSDIYSHRFWHLYHSDWAHHLLLWCLVCVWAWPVFALANELIFFFVLSTDMCFRFNPSPCFYLLIDAPVSRWLVPLWFDFTHRRPRNSCLWTPPCITFAYWEKSVPSYNFSWHVFCVENVIEHLNAAWQHDTDIYASSVYFAVYLWMLRWQCPWINFFDWSIIFMEMQLKFNMVRSPCNCVFCEHCTYVEFYQGRFSSWCSSRYHMV
jgi:hypothetical protein